MEEENASPEPEEVQPEAQDENPDPDEEILEPDEDNSGPKEEITEPIDENLEAEPDIAAPEAENDEPEPEITEPESEEPEDPLEEAEEPSKPDPENSIDDSDLLRMIEEAKQDLLESPLDGSTGQEGEGEEEEGADRSSSPSDVGPSANKEKRLSKHRGQGQDGAESDDSARSLDPEEAVLPPAGPRTPPPTAQGETQTDWRQSGVEIVNLPLLREMKRAQGEPKGRWEEKVLGTEVTARFKEPMPTVVLPLDRFYPMDSPLAAACAGRGTGRGSNLEVVSTYTTRTANNVVDAQVTYRDDKKGGIRVDIDGGGLQVVLDVEQKNKRKRKVNKWELRMKREPLSLRPPKPKFNRCPDLLRKLAWLEDKAEDRHVLRMQVSRDAKHWKPSLPHRVPPDFGPRWKDWHAKPYPEEPPTKGVGRTLVSTNQHVGLMMYARHLEGKRRRARKLAPQPSALSPPAELRPSERPASVYEDDRTRRLREAREHYARVSMGTLPALQVQEKEREELDSTIELSLPADLEDTIEEDGEEPEGEEIQAEEEEVQEEEAEIQEEEEGIQDEIEEEPAGGEEEADTEEGEEAAQEIQEEEENIEVGGEEQVAVEEEPEAENEEGEEENIEGGEEQAGENEAEEEEAG